MVTDARVERGMAAQLELRLRRLSAGESHLGWKMGFGTAAARERLQTDAPLVGFLTRQVAVESGSEVSVQGWGNPVLEPEIAIHIGRDLPANPDRTAAADAIAALGPAIELADLDAPNADVEEILSGNIFNRHVLLGEPDTARQGGNATGISARASKNGEQVAATDQPEALTGDLVGIVQHLATLLAANGEALRAGDVVIAGSVVPGIQVASGDRVTVEIEPLGSLEVALT